MDDPVRVTLDNGRWWELKARLTVRDRRKIDEYVQSAAFRYVNNLKETGIEMNELRSLASPTTDNGVQETRTPDEDFAYLLYGSVDWSFPGEITEESVGDRDEDDARRVVAKARSLYDRTEEQVKNLSGTLPSGPVAMAQ